MNRPARPTTGIRRTIGKLSAIPSATIEAARSVSDDGSYPDFCARASRDPETFLHFRANKGYQRILEHLTLEQGRELLELMERARSPFLQAETLGLVAQNDLVGGPNTFVQVGEERLTPTTLRYLKIATDIVTTFDADEIHTVAEIGVGYGGQVRVLDAVGIGASYDLLDLAPVLSLAERYLECFILTGSYRTRTLNQTADLMPDLVLSMYALSELPRALQMVYFEKVLKRASAGYLVMNDCWDFDRLSKEEWVDVLGAEVRPELPNTAEGNYALVWGHRK